MTISAQSIGIQSYFSNSAITATDGETSTRHPPGVGVQRQAET